MKSHTKQHVYSIGQPCQFTQSTVPNIQNISTDPNQPLGQSMGHLQPSNIPGINESLNQALEIISVDIIASAEQQIPNLKSLKEKGVNQNLLKYGNQQNQLIATIATKIPPQKMQQFQQNQQPQNQNIIQMQNGMPQLDKVNTNWLMAEEMGQNNQFVKLNSDSQPNTHLADNIKNQKGKICDQQLFKKWNDDDSETCTENEGSQMFQKKTQRKRQWKKSVAKNQKREEESQDNLSQGDKLDKSNDCSQQNTPGQTFQKHQTKILQKWFLENIQHPYLKKDDKAMLADQTGLSKKQITGWFTNNRKRKYQKVALVAKKKNKDLSYVREVVKLKFDKDMDQSLTGSDRVTGILNTQTLPHTVNANNQQVMQFANKIWGNQSSEAKNNIFNQIQTIEQQQIIRPLIGQINKQSDLTMMESIQNKRQKNSSMDYVLYQYERQRMIMSMNNQEQPDQGVFQNIEQPKLTQIEQQQITVHGNQKKQVKTKILKKFRQIPSSKKQTAALKVKANMSNFTFNQSTLDNLHLDHPGALSMAEIPFNHLSQKFQEYNQHKVEDTSNQNKTNTSTKGIETIKILQNFSKLLQHQKTMDSIIPQPEKFQQSTFRPDDRSSSFQINSSSQQTTNPSKQTQFIPIMYAQCPQNKQNYMPLVDIKTQIKEYISHCQQSQLKNFIISNPVQLSRTISQMEKKKESESGSGSSLNQTQLTQIEKIESYVSNFINNKILQNSNQSSNTGKQTKSISTQEINKFPDDMNTLALNQQFKEIMAQNQAPKMINDQISQLLMDKVFNIQNKINNEAMLFNDTALANDKYQSVPKVQEDNSNNVEDKQIHSAKANNSIWDNLIPRNQITVNINQSQNNVIQPQLQGQGKSDQMTFQLLKKLKEMEAASLQQKLNQMKKDQGGDMKQLVKQNPNLKGSVQNSMNSWLGLAGSVNIGYPSSNSYQQVNSNSNGSNGSQGINAEKSSIICNSGLGSNIPNTNESASSNDSKNDIQQSKNSKNKSQKTAQINKNQKLSPNKDEDLKSKRIKSQNDIDSKQAGNPRESRTDGQKPLSETKEAVISQRLASLKKEQQSQGENKGTQIQHLHSLMEALQNIQTANKIDVIGLIENFITSAANKNRDSKKKSASQQDDTNKNKAARQNSPMPSPIDEKAQTTSFDQITSQNKSSSQLENKLSSTINNNKPSTQDDATEKNANAGEFCQSFTNIGSINIANNNNINSSTAFNNEQNFSQMYQDQIYKQLQLPQNSQQLQNYLQQHLMSTQNPSSGINLNSPGNQNQTIGSQQISLDQFISNQLKNNHSNLNFFGNMGSQYGQLSPQQQTLQQDASQFMYNQGQQSYTQSKYNDFPGQSAQNYDTQEYGQINQLGQLNYQQLMGQIGQINQMSQNPQQLSMNYFQKSHNGLDQLYQQTGLGQQAVGPNLNDQLLNQNQQMQSQGGYQQESNGLNNYGGQGGIGSVINNTDAFGLMGILGNIGQRSGSQPQVPQAGANQDAKKAYDDKSSQLKGIQNSYSPQQNMVDESGNQANNFTAKSNTINNNQGLSIFQQFQNMNQSNYYN